MRRFLAPAAAALATAAVLAPVAATAQGAEWVHVTVTTSRISPVDVGWTTPTYVPGVKVTATLNSCRRGELYHLDGVLHQDGLTVPEVQAALGVGEMYCADGSPVAGGTTFADKRLHPGGATVTYTLTRDDDALGTVVVTKLTRQVTIPR